MTAAELARLGRTVVRLRPGQAAHRARLRAQRAGLRRFPGATGRFLAGPDPSAAAGWPDAFRPLDAAPDRWPSGSGLRAGKIALLGVTRPLDDGWRHAGAPRLWRFHLHYWDWAWGLAPAGPDPAGPDPDGPDPDGLAGRAVFARLWRSWQASAGCRHGDAWHPYPAALRAWSWCGQHRELVAGSDLEPAFTAALAAHAGFLRRHLEYDVGGNHLIKGLKAVTGLAVFFADERLLRQSLRRLERQVRRQVLGDGGHFERAPAYHCQVLADLIDVADLLRAAGREPPAGITAAIAAMRRWLGAVIAPDGQVPLLNDGYPVDRGLLAALRPGQEPDEPLLVLPDTGLVRIAAGGWQLLADVGAPCPRSLPAHAHADTFGCLVYVDGGPLLADTGTSTYEPGPVRGYERSTAAHSTVQLDGTDSTEVWGAFRAGRRARVSGLVTEASRVGIRCEAVHDGYRHLPGRPRHRRRWTLAPGGLLVEDAVTGRGRHEVVVHWQLAPGWSARVAGDTAHLYGPAGPFTATVTATVPVLLEAASRPVAAGFGVRADAPVLTCRADAPLPVLITTTWSRAAAGGAHAEGSP